MRVKIPHDISDGLSRLAVTLVKGVSVLVHGVENAALNRL